MSQVKTTIIRKEIQTTDAKRPVSKLAAAGSKAATPRRGVAAKRTTKRGATPTEPPEMGRTTRKAPRAAPARTSKQPTKKKAGTTMMPKRSTKKRSAKKRSTTGRAKRR